MPKILNILIIDDDEDDCLLISERLEEFLPGTCKFTTCYKRTEAELLLRQQTFYLCILDYQLAGFKGLDILKVVSDADLATPIVMLTGQNDETVAKDAIKSGAQDFVMKSAINDSIFEKSIQYAITRKELEFARSISKISKRQNIAKDKFIGHLSHELRTPLTSIIGYTSLLLDNQETHPFHKELSIISNNSKHLLSLLNDVLDLSKIQADKFELRPEETNFKSLIGEVYSLVSVNVLDKGLKLIVEATTKIPKSFYVDSVRFKQVLLNLLSNSIKFTEIGTIRMGIAFIQPSNILEVSVVDSGIGMTKEQIQTIFNPFTQVEDVANRRAGGAGLGLSICYEIIKEMGGKIEVNSCLDEGSSFVVTLPITSKDLQLVTFDTDFILKPQLTPPPLKLNGKVLVVDDVLEIRKLAGYFIESTSVSVEYASNGIEALTKVKQAYETKAPFDVMFIDLHMPKMTGIEAVKKIRRFETDLVIVAMTAAVSKGLEDNLTQNGFNELLSKPIYQEAILSILKSALDSAQHKNLIANSDISNSTATRNKLKIHVVEDDKDSALVMKLMLQQLGCEVVSSEDARSAIKFVRTENDADLHLFDLGLPDLSGKAFLKEIFALPINGKVSVLSGSQPDKSMLDEFKIHQYLIKPIDKDELNHWLISNK